MAPTPHAESALDAFDLNAFSAELERLSAINQELLGAPPPPALDDDAPAADLPTADEVAHVLHENAALRARVDELEALLSQAASAGDDGWVERQREYEALLEEKSEVIRALHLRLQEQHAAPARGPAGGAAPDEDALYRLKEELEDERRRLQDDEESMMQQMRQMEMALAKDRAELARQRQEVQRMHAELNREIEMASRDPGLRDRLMAMRRPAEPARPASTPALPAAAATPTASPKGPPRSSGFLRRMFG